MGKKFHLTHFQVLVKRQATLSGNQIDLKIIVTRKIRRAVDRNRIKRVVREFFRAKRELLPGNVVVCRIQPSAENIRNAELFKELHTIL